MLPLEHSAILSTFIELPVVIKIFVLSTLHRFNCILAIDNVKFAFQQSVKFTIIKSFFMQLKMIYKNSVKMYFAVVTGKVNFEIQ